MKNKLPRKKEQQRMELEQEEISSPEEEVQEEPQEVSLIPRMLKKEALFVTFTGLVEKGSFQEDDSLTAFCTLMHGPDWQRVHGEKSFISQVASSNGKEITWNLPFEVSFETTYIAGWPQLVIALYGTDFFGRSFVRGYCNVHLPSQTGKHTRKMQVFRPLPQSTISGIFGFIGGTLAEYKDHEKILATGDGREVTRVRSTGEVSISMTTVKHNFKNYGY